MTETPKHPEPFVIEIVVDGEVRSRCLAAEFEITETRGALTLEATRWLASFTLPPNPIFDPPPPDPSLADNPLIIREDQN